MNPNSGRYAVIALALAFAGLEMAAVHLLLDTGTAVRLAADAAVVIVVAACLWAALGRRRCPDKESLAAECARQRRAVRFNADRETRARECGRSGRA
ncbi:MULTISPECIES: hypothetical protein [Streptomyces]|uniref:Uncharacterized protein n=2 Tax=Streptomyces TaxID=1883 RepID=A0A646K993_STRJU|nr:MULTISPECIES: hypothetical protein [Streptomyces]MQS39947.1 hypothetical protein [Streptomyces katsurahamanus]MQS98741.1 hypothetical protein [Streptomyces jumonjinensis]